MNITFDEYKMVMLLDNNPALQEAFGQLGFAFDSQWMKLSILQGGVNHRAKMALKKIFDGTVAKDEDLSKQYSEIEALKVQKHFYYEIMETNGERIYLHKGLTTLEEGVDPNEWLDEHTRNFYDNFEEEDGVYWFDGEVICEPYKIQELSWEEHETMKRIMV